MSASFRARWQLRLFAAFAVIMLALAPTAARQALAHPLGNFTTNRYARIEVYRDRIQLHYVVDVAEIPTFQAFTSIDRNGDGQASPDELTSYATKAGGEYPTKFELAADGRRLSPQVIESEAQLLPGQGGLDTLRIAVVYEAPTRPGSGAVAISFHDDNFSSSQGWKEIVVRPSEGARVQVDPALLVDRSDALRSYPAESLKAAPQMSDVRFEWTSGTGSPAPEHASAQLATSGRGGSGFASVFKDLSDGNVSVGFLLLSLVVALAFGAQHALGPGHGKTMVAAYLVGTKGTPKHAVALGLTVTATHTSTVYLLGAVTLVAAAWISPELVYLWMGVAAGVMVVAFGLALFVQRSLSLRRQSRHSSEHRHGLFGKVHSHDDAHHDEYAGETVAADDASGGVGWRSLLSLGVLGGLLPCPSAVVVMVAAISQGQVLLGMLLIVAFSLGLAGVLVGIGLSLVLSRRLPARQRKLLSHPLVGKLVAVMPVISALIVTAVGLGLTYQAVGRV